MPKATIISITQVKAYTPELRALNSRWKHYPMQIIKTNMGTFIDHKVKRVGHWLGVNYEPFIGKEYEYECMVDNNGRKVKIENPTKQDNVWLRPIN